MTRAGRVTCYCRTFPQVTGVLAVTNPLINFVTVIKDRVTGNEVRP